MTGDQAVGLQDCWLQDHGRPKINYREDSGSDENLHSSVNFDWRCNDKLSIVILKQSTVNSMSGEYLEKGSIQTDTCQTSSMESSKRESKRNSERQKAYLLELEKGIEGHKGEVLCESGLTIGISGNHISRGEQLYCPVISVKNSIGCPETSIIDVVHNWIVPRKDKTSNDFKGLQMNPKYNAILDLPNIGHDDCDSVNGVNFGKMDKTICFLEKGRTKEAVFSGLSDGAQCNHKSSQDNSISILHKRMGGTEAEEIKIVTHIHHGRKKESFERSSQYIKGLAVLEEDGMEKKVEMLESELLEVKKQNHKLETLLKCVLRRTDKMQQSLQDRKRYWHRRRHLICKFALHLRKKRK